jgi:23S rRNA pseudouridine1911/1915/1917 synthase
MAKQIAKKTAPEVEGESKTRMKRKSTRSSVVEEAVLPVAAELSMIPAAEVHALQTIEVTSDGAGQRLDQFLAAQLDGVSRSRVQMLMDQGDVLVNGEREKASMKLRGGERITITGEPRPTPLKAIAEDIPLDVIYEDADLAVINKPAGMMVHAGSGQNEDERSKGTLVNALLHRFKKLSSTGGDLRPGIVHRLDKDTSGLIVVAKNDRAHAALGEMFSSRQIKKTYIALVQGWLERDRGTINASVGRDPVRRTRMTTQPSDNSRSAVSHYEVVRRLANRFGKFTLVRVRIETGRTHQIRVHMASIGHPVVGDTLYGGAGQLTDQVAAQAAQSKAARRKAEPERLRLGRNFLHAARLEFPHPKSGKVLQLEAPLPAELEEFLAKLAPPMQEPAKQEPANSVPANPKTVPIKAASVKRQAVQG